MCFFDLQLMINTVILAARSINSSMTSAVTNARLLGQLDVDILVALTSTMSSVVSALAMDHTRAIGLRYRKAAVQTSVGAVQGLLLVGSWGQPAVTCNSLPDVPRLLVYRSFGIYLELKSTLASNIEMC